MHAKIKKDRLDVLVTARGLARSRDMAQRLIRAGEVFVGGHPATKPGHRVSADAEISVKARPRFVSRGGEKLKAALTRFSIDVNGRVCLDIGSSTGGFTDCLLQHGAVRVVCVDVGTGQLDWSLRTDERVVVMERTNARTLQPGDLDCRPSLATFDVSFISLTLVVPPVTQLLEAGAELVTLIKPQFEAGREEVGRGGVVRDAAVHDAVVAKIRRFCELEVGLVFRGLCPSPLKGPAGNTEFLAYWQKP